MATDEEVKKANRDYMRKWRSKNPDKRRQIATKSRVSQLGLEVEDFDIEDLWTGFCGLCGDQLVWDLEYPDWFSKSIDHKTPLSEGGGHTRSNTHWTHLICNTKKINGRFDRQSNPMVE